MEPTTKPQSVESLWQPLGDGISYYKAVGGTIYRSRDGHLTFAPDADADAFAKAIGAEVERVLRRAMNGELHDPATLKKMTEQALAASGLDFSALGLK